MVFVFDQIGSLDGKLHLSLVLQLVPKTDGMFIAIWMVSFAILTDLFANCLARVQMSSGPKVGRAMQLCGQRSVRASCNSSRGCHGRRTVSNYGNSSSQWRLVAMLP